MNEVPNWLLWLIGVPAWLAGLALVAIIFRRK